MSTSLQIPPARQIGAYAPQPFDQFDERPRDEFSSFWGVLRRRRRTLLALFVSFFVVVMLVTLLAPKTYVTTTKLIAGDVNAAGNYGSTNVNSGLPVLNALMGQANGRSPETYVELMQETPIAQRVISDLGLKTSPSKLLSAIKAKPVTNTSVIELDVSWKDAHTSAAIANDFASVFVNRERELISGQADAALGFLASALPKAEAAQGDAETALAQYEATHPTAYANSQDQQGTNSSTVASIATKIGQLQVDQGQAAATLGEVTSQMGSMSAIQNTGNQVAENPVAVTLKQQLATVNVQLATALKQYTDQHPTVIALKQQQQQLEQQIASLPPTVIQVANTGPNPTYQSLAQQAAQLRAEITSDTAQLASLKSQQTNLMAALPLQSQRLNDLQNKAKLAAEVTTALQQRFNDATVAKASSISDVEITQPADPAQAAIRPDLRINTVLGLVLGIVFAIGGVFAIEFFDNTYKDERDVTHDLPLPVLASIPNLSMTNGKQTALPWLRALTVDSFLQIVTALHYSSDKPLRSLAVASPLPGDGKSTLCLNLAAALGEMTPNVLLIDADLRRPTLHTALGIENTSGLSDVLIGARNVFSEIRATKYAGLDLLPAGPKVPTPLKLLQSEGFEKMIEALLERYQMIIFDTPPVLSVFDCALVSAKVDGTVMVLSAGRTDSRSTKRALKRLTAVGNPNLLGVILNRAPAEAKDYAYYRTSQPTMMLDAAEPTSGEPASGEPT